MGTGWRKAFCTSIRRDTSDSTTATTPRPQSPRSYSRLKFFSSSSFSSSSGGSNPSTPRLQQQQQQPMGDVVLPSPALRCRTSKSEAVLAEKEGCSSAGGRLQCRTGGGGGGGGSNSGSPIPSPRPPLFQSPANSNPCSPRSPSRFALLKNSLRLSRSRCGICMRSVNAVQGTAIFIAECSHSFHFPCISSLVRKQGSLVCPVCAATWRQVPLLSVLPQEEEGTVVEPGRDDNDRDIAGSDRGWSATIKQGRGRDRSPPETKLARIAVAGKGGVESKPSSDAAAKVYNDDEPLLSPGGSGARFNPIPEADDEDEEDGKGSDVEFQGFFSSNPSPPSPAGSGRRLQQQQQHHHHHHHQTTSSSTGGLQVSLIPDVALLSSGRNHDKYVVAIKVKALPPPTLPYPSSARNATGSASSVPLLDPTRRAPIDLVLVLDVGGSMMGAKFHMLKRAIRQVISSLSPADRLSIVAFSSAAKRLLPLKRMTPQGQRCARRLVDRLVCSQGNGVIGDALRKATRVLEDRRERNPVASIMLLSDGQQQQQKGETPRHTSSLSCRSSSTTSSAGTRFAHLEIPVYPDGYNDGTTTPVQEAPEDAFARCVGGLLSVVVQDVKLQLAFTAGEITAVYSCSGQPAAVLGAGGSVRIGDLYADEERDLLVELRVPAAVLGGDHQSVLNARCSYKDPGTQETMLCEEQPLFVPFPISHHQRRHLTLLHRSPQTASTDGAGPKAERLRNLFVTTRAIVEARRLADLNDTATALHLLSSARSLLLQSTSISADENLRALEAELAELQRRRQHRRRREGEREVLPVVGAAENGGGEALTPTSAWRAAERLAKLAIMRKSLNRVSDLHGFEDARF